jgi:hypothetical protein
MKKEPGTSEKGEHRQPETYLTGLKAIDETMMLMVQMFEAKAKAELYCC